MIAFWTRAPAGAIWLVMSATKTEASARPRRRKKAPAAARPLVGVIMGSSSDWPAMAPAAEALARAGVPFECRVVSAHRTPELMFEYARTAAARGLRCIIAGAGGAAHLPGMTAALTELPVLGVPVRSRAMDGVDSLLSIAQMPFGVPVCTFPVGAEGAAAAAAFALRILGAASAPRRDAPALNPQRRRAE